MTRRAEISERHVEELAGLGLDYWWVAVRLAHVSRELEAAAPGAECRFLDFGCGTGELTERIAEQLRPARALGIDGTDAALAHSAERRVPVQFADLRAPLELPFEPNVVTALDVLEHLADPIAALGQLAAACAEDALLVVMVPAMPSLHSRWDELSGHHRRYTRRLLREHLAAGGWDVAKLRHVFGYCVPPAWIDRKLLGRLREFEFPRVSRGMNALLTAAGHLERRLGSPLPFGTSLLAVARKRRIP